MAALMAHGVDNLQLRGFEVDWQGKMPDYYTSAIAVNTFKNLRIDGFEGIGPRAGTPAIALHEGEDVTMRDAHASTGDLVSIEAVSGRKVLPGNQSAGE
jgi:hypothetical protein